MAEKPFHAGPPAILDALTMARLYLADAEEALAAEPSPDRFLAARIATAEHATDSALALAKTIAVRTNRKSQNVLDEILEVARQFEL